MVKLELDSKDIYFWVIFGMTISMHLTWMSKIDLFDDELIMSDLEL